jgi:hypothetical protein
MNTLTQKMNGVKNVRKAISSKNQPAPSAIEEEPKIPNDFTGAIYEALTKAFANKNPTQLFSVCWPGTIIDHDRLSWDPSEETGGNMPERSLIRSAQLLDIYVPPSPLTQPDGTKVSDRYRAAISQLGPLPNIELIELQNIIRNKLDTTVTIEENGKEVEVTIAKWFSILNQKWATAKRQWGEEQQRMQQFFKDQYPLDKNKWWNEYLNWYANNAEGWIDKINSAYDELISTFPLVEWEDAIAVLDTKDNAILTEAKQLLRNISVPIPRQEGIKYVPATGIPYSWPNQIKPSTKFIDLLSDPESQQMKLETAVQQLQIEARSWMAILPQVNSQQLSDAANAFEDAVGKFASAQSGLIGQYTENTVTAVQAFCDIMESRGKFLGDVSDSNEQTKLTDEVSNLESSLARAAGKTPATNIDWKLIKDIADKIGKGQNDLVEKQQALINSGVALAGAADKFLSSKARSTEFAWLEPYVRQLEEKLATLNAQIANRASASNVYYNATQSVSGSVNPNESPDFGAQLMPSVLNYPDNPNWTEIKITLNAEQLESSDKMNTFFSQLQWGVDLFLGSAGGSDMNSGAAFASTYMEQSSEIQIGFLAMKVLIERPWMKPEVFINSKGYFRSLDMGLAPVKQVTTDDLLGPKGNDLILTLINDYLFPSYPVAMLVAKDITVKVNLKAAETKRLKDYQKSVKSQGGGFLCFSISNSESAESNNESFNSYCMAGQFIARSPAPQIIGYWNQLTPSDNSTVLTQDTARDIAAAIGFTQQLNQAHSAGYEVKKTPVRPVA